MMLRVRLPVAWLRKGNSNCFWLDTRVTAQSHIQMVTISTKSALSSTSSNDYNENKVKIEKEPLKAQFVDEDPRMPPRQRLKNLVVVYGPTAMVLHITLSLCFLGITYTVVRWGVDVPSLMERFELTNETYMKIIANGGTFGLAYALYKGMMPLRVLVTLFLTPKVARKLQAIGLIKKRF